jgi:hypothetical protein
MKCIPDIRQEDIDQLKAVTELDYMRGDEHCLYMKKLIELGAIVAYNENIDEKGWSRSYYLKLPDGKPIMIRHCPGCGAQITRLCPVPPCRVDTEVYHPEIDDIMSEPCGPEEEVE